MTQTLDTRADFARLVTSITGDGPFTDAELCDLLADPGAQALACELDAIWHLTGTLAPPMPAGSSHDT